MEHQIVKKFAELQWRIARLEEVKDGTGRAGQMLDTQNKSLNQDQCSQFFLGLKLSQMVKIEDKSTIEE